MTMQSNLSISAKTLFLTLGFVLVLAFGLIVAGAGSVQAQGRSGYEYTVQPGDSWPAIANLVKLSVADLQSANPQAVRANGWVTIGEKIFIPTAPGAEMVTHVVQYAESWGSISLQYGVKVRLLQGVNPKLMRSNQVIYREEKVLVPPPADMAGLTQTGQAAQPTQPTAAPVTGFPLVPVTATPAPPVSGTEGVTVTETAGMTETETVVVTETVAPIVETDPLIDPLNLCPGDFAQLPAYMDAVLTASANDPTLLRDRLESCGQLTGGEFLVQDLTGDGLDDLLVQYLNPDGEAANTPGDLILFAGSENGFVESFRAKAAGRVALLATRDINEDGLPDLAWMETNCGASTCFGTVNVRSWDGAAWQDWTAGTITLANAEVALLGAEEGGQGDALVLVGGAFGSAGAGPQRQRTETWVSVDGAPYALANTEYAPSDCLYFAVIDANATFLKELPDLSASTGVDVAALLTPELYLQAVSDGSLKACGSRENEVDELRAFSIFRLAVFSGYSGDAVAASEVIGLLSADYPDSIYDRLGQFWNTAYVAAGNDAAQACQAATVFAQENPESWQILADFGYANPTFSAKDVCPVLASALTNTTFVPVVGTAPTDTVTATAPITTTAPVTVPVTAPITATETLTTTLPITVTQVITSAAAVAETVTETVTITVSDGPGTNSSATDGVDVQATAQPAPEPAPESTPAPVPEAAPATAPESAPESAPATAPEGVLAPDAEQPTCPTSLEAYIDATTQALVLFEGDPLILETWLRLCGAMTDELGAVLVQDLNNDQIDDFVVMPVVISDAGQGPGGAGGMVLVYYGNPDGAYTLAVESDTRGLPAPLALADINDDGLLDLAWTIEGCGVSCLTQVQILSWNGEAYTTGIEPGAMMIEAQMRLEAVPANALGQGQQLVMVGGANGTSQGGLDITHTEVWQSVDGSPYGRIAWTYDRENKLSNCLGLRLVEADVALQASPLIGYEPAIQLYQLALADDSLEACSIMGTAEADELSLLRGLAAFRLAQTLTLNGEADTAGGMLADFAVSEPKSPYLDLAKTWMDSYAADGDVTAACEPVTTALTKSKLLWQITDNFGNNHPPLAASQICYVVPSE